MILVTVVGTEFIVTSAITFNSINQSVECTIEDFDVPQTVSINLIKEIRP